MTREMGVGTIPSMGCDLRGKIPENVSTSRIVLVAKDLTYHRALTRRPDNQPKWGIVRIIELQRPRSGDMSMYMRRGNTRAIH